MQSEVYPIIVPTRSSLKSFNFYLLKNHDGLSLIDAGVNSTKCWEYLTQVLNKIGFTLNDLDQIIITHNHEDHVGLVNRIVGQKDIPVYVSEKSIHRLKRDKDFFSMRIEFFANLYNEMGCRQEGEKQVQKLKEAFKEHGKKKLQADLTPIQNDTFSSLIPLKTPGHSPDHMIFHHVEEKSVFGGDLLLSHISSNALVEPDVEGKRILTVLELEQSLRNCAALEAEIVYPGHGELIRNHKELIEKRLSGIKRKADRVLTYIKKDIHTASDLAKMMYRDKYESQFSLVMSEVIGYLDYLETHKRIEKEMQKGVWHYSIRG